MILRRALPALAVASLLAACQTPVTPHRDYAEFGAAQDPTTVASHIADRVGACWFKANRPGFAGLSYAPELNSYANHPRVLIVPKKAPHELPRLVIEVTRTARGSSVKLFGPLMATPEARPIARDVQAWVGGSSGCQA